MSEGKKKRPLKKSSETPQGSKPMNVIGSKHAQQIPPEVLEELQKIQGGQQNLVPPDDYQQPAKPGIELSQDPNKPRPKPKVKSKITEVPLDTKPEELPHVDPTAEAQAPQPPQPQQPQPQSQFVPPPQEEEDFDEGVAEKSQTVTPQFQQQSDTIPYRASLEHRAFQVPLPSKGVLYGGAYASGFVAVRPMRTKEESLLYSPGDTLGHLNKIINNCVVKHEIPPEELTINDRFAILLYLRTFSYGSDYDLPFRCANCGRQTKITINIAEELEMKQMQDGVEEPFEVDLPSCGDYIHFRILRGKDEEHIARRVKKFNMQSIDESDPSNIYRLALALLGINGVEITSFDKKVEYVENLLPIDSNEFRLAMEEVDGKIDTTIVRDCPACGYTNEFMMPFTAEFFRASRRKRK